MSDKKPDKLTDIELLHQWMGAVGGNFSQGDSELKSVEISKDGDKLTVELRKKKQKKTKENADRP